MSAIIRQRSGVILISLRSQLGRTTSGPTGEEIPSTGATGDAALPLGKAVQSNRANYRLRLRLIVDKSLSIKHLPTRFGPREQGSRTRPAGGGIGLSGGDQGGFRL